MFLILVATTLLSSNYIQLDSSTSQNIRSDLFCQGDFGPRRLPRDRSWPMNPQATALNKYRSQVLDKVIEHWLNTESVSADLMLLITLSRAKKAAKVELVNMGDKQNVSSKTALNSLITSVESASCLELPAWYKGNELMLKFSMSEIRAAQALALKKTKEPVSP